MKRLLLLLLCALFALTKSRPGTAAETQPALKVKLSVASDFSVVVTPDFGSEKDAYWCVGSMVDKKQPWILLRHKVPVQLGPFGTSSEHLAVGQMLAEGAVFQCIKATREPPIWHKLDIDRDALSAGGSFIAPDGLISPSLEWVGLASMWGGRLLPYFAGYAHCEITAPAPAKPGAQPCTATLADGKIRITPNDPKQVVQQVTLFRAPTKGSLDRTKGPQIRLNVVECELTVRGAAPTEGIVAGASLQRVTITSPNGQCSKSITSLEVEGKAIGVDYRDPMGPTLRNVPASILSGARRGKAFFNGTPVGAVAMDVVSAIAGKGTAYVRYNVEPQHDPHGLFSAASGSAARVSESDPASLPVAVVDPGGAAEPARSKLTNSIINTIELNAGSMALMPAAGFNIEPAPDATCEGTELATQYAWVLASNSWGGDVEPTTCAQTEAKDRKPKVGAPASPSRCVLQDGLQRLSFRALGRHADKLSVTVQLIEQSRLKRSEVSRQRSKVASSAATDKNPAQTCGSPDDKKRGTTCRPAANPNEEPSRALENGNDKDECVREKLVLETSLDLAGGAVRESVPLPIRTALVVDCAGAFESEKGKPFTRWIGDGEMRSIDENDVRNGLCSIRFRPTCREGESPDAHGCRIDRGLDALYGPQVIVVNVSRGTTPAAPAVYSLPSPDSGESSVVRVPLPKPNTESSDGVYTVEVQMRAQPLADVRYRSTVREKLVADGVAAENRDLKMVAQLRPRGTFGWSWRPFGDSFRSYVTVPVQITGVRFPASPRDLRTSRDPLAYQLMTPKVGLLAVLEPWSYDSGENPTALNMGLATGFQFFQIGEGTVATSYLLGVQATLPLEYSGTTPSRFKSQLGTSLTGGIFWELDLRDGLVGGNHLLVSLGLNFATVFSGN